jgi:hypothetical protein
MQPQPRAGRDRASVPGQRHASRRTRPTGTDALPRQRATLSSRSAPEMKAARERPASLLYLVGQVPEQRQGRGPKALEGLD